MNSSRQPPVTDVSDVPPLAVYHICCICRKPRSARYHREHPIPIDGHPPPGGICRRCRVVEVEDDRSLDIHVIGEGRSNDIRIGVASFVPEEDPVTHEEVKYRRAQRILKEPEWLELEMDGSIRYEVDDVRSSGSNVTPPIKTREGVVYRYVRQPKHTQPPQPPHPPAGPAGSTTREGVIYRQSPANAGPGAVVSPPELDMDVQQAVGHFRTVTIPPPPPKEEETEVVVMRNRTPGGISTDGACHSNSAHESSVSMARVRSSTYTEPEIRRLAREEVERYRRLERKIETHKDPYAHGRIVEIRRVPVERRIEQDRDVTAELPWKASQSIPRRDSALATIGTSSSSNESNASNIQQSQVIADRKSRDSVASTTSSLSAALSEQTQMPADDRTLYAYRHVSARGQPFQKAKPGSSSAAADVEKLPRRVDELQREYSRQDRSQAQSQIVDALIHQQHRAHEGSAQAPDTDTEVKLAHSRAEKKAVPTSLHRSPDHEYEYVRRVVTPITSRTLQPRDSAPQYEESNEYLSCRSAPHSLGDAVAGARSHMESIRRRVSDASSRVHFSKKLDISPTPPESDASSSEFRYSRGRQEASLITGKDVPNRAPRRDPIALQRKATQPPGLAAGGASDGTQPPPPLSESPTREQLMPKSRRGGYGPSVEKERKSSSLNVEHSSQSSQNRHTGNSAHDGYGPYVREEKRSASVDVQDGSTVASASWHSSEDDPYDRRRGRR